ncbi:MAG: permease [Alphaproteobacteria bacterium]|nr:permease [Alphaproteobacteria bacterium]
MNILNSLFRTKDKQLGVAERGRRYDLPLNKSAGTGFLILLVALMTFLAVMALGASFTLGEMAQRWASGLENRLTVEIPAEITGGALRSPSDIAYLSEKTAEALKADPAVETVEIMGEADVQALISPWLGEDLSFEGLPLPGLISVKMRIGTPEAIERLRHTLKGINQDIHLDAHESWLKDLLRLTGALKFAAAAITLIIALTTIAAIAGAVRSRMAEHKADVELLHLMGASDLYITRQFQRHALILALRGALAGTAAGGLALLLIGLSAGNGGDTGLLPNLHLGTKHVLTLILLPCAACLIASLAARFTVLRVLALMP